MIKTEKLKTLRDYLETNKAFVQQHLLMSEYFYSADPKFHSIEAAPPKSKVELSSLDCETSCCALGFAALSGLFDNNHNQYQSFSLQFFIDMEDNDELRSRKYIFIEDHLSEEESIVWDYLFGGENDNDADLLLQRLDYVIEHGSTPEEYLP